MPNPRFERKLNRLMSRAAIDNTFMLELLQLVYGLVNVGAQPTGQYDYFNLFDEGTGEQPPVGEYLALVSAALAPDVTVGVYSPYQLVDGFDDGTQPGLASAGQLTAFRAFLQDNGYDTSTGDSTTDSVCELLSQTILNATISFPA